VEIIGLDLAAEIMAGIARARAETDLALVGIDLDRDGQTRLVRSLAAQVRVVRIRGMDVRSLEDRVVRRSGAVRRSVGLRTASGQRIATTCAAST
jgi:hypothetical protein